MKTLLRILIILFILIAASIAFLLTPAGLRLSAQIVMPFIPGKIDYKKISGVLIGPIVIDDLRYQNKDETITIKQFILDWQPLDLLKREVHITSVDIRALHFVSTNPLAAKKWDAQTIQTLITSIFSSLQKSFSFFHTVIDHVSLQHTKIQNADDAEPTMISQVLLQSNLSATHFNVQLFATLTKPYPLKMQFSLSGQPDQYHTQLNMAGYKTQFLLSGTGNKQGIQLSTQNTLLMGATVQLQTQIHWQPATRWNLVLTASNIDAAVANSLGIQNAEIHLSGNVAAHALVANVTTKKGMLNVSLQGHLNAAQNQWQGDLQKLTLHWLHNNTWKLQKSAQIQIAHQTIVITPICLARDSGDAICVSGRESHQKINGLANIQLQNINALIPKIPNVFISAGQLTSQLQITGMLAQPIVSGSLHFSQGHVLIPKIHIALNQITASVATQNHWVNFQLQAFSKNKPLTIKGTMDLSHLELPIKMTVTSDQLLFVNTEEYTGYGTANLNVLADLSAKKINITGHVLISRGLIAPNDSQSTKTLPMGDIVYVGNVTPHPINPWSVYCDIDALLGDHVRIRVAGFNTLINGSLQLTQQPHQALLATGMIFTHHGIYSVFGQTLNIEPNSYLTYTHSLLGNPTLNLRASKMIPENVSANLEGFAQRELMVGVQLHGTVDSPKITFYANRGNLSQADILSYILLGYATAKTETPGNTDFMLRALAAANVTSQGLLGKQNIATVIQNGLGLSEMGVESETMVDSSGNPLDRQSAFVVGKSLSRKFYARYSIGLLDPVNVFQLRYVFDKHWAIQSDSSSLGNGGDVLYTISKD